MRCIKLFKIVMQIFFYLECVELSFYSESLFLCCLLSETKFSKEKKNSMKIFLKLAVVIYKKSSTQEIEKFKNRI
jgi:hypothetical protein